MRVHQHPMGQEEQEQAEQQKTNRLADYLHPSLHRDCINPTPTHQHSRACRKVHTHSAFSLQPDVSSSHYFFCTKLSDQQDHTVRSSFFHERHIPTRFPLVVSPPQRRSRPLLHPT